MAEKKPEKGFAGGTGRNPGPIWGHRGVWSRCPVRVLRGSEGTHVLKVLIVVGKMCVKC